MFPTIGQIAERCQTIPVADSCDLDSRILPGTPASQAGMIPGTKVQMDLSNAFIFNIFTEVIYVSGSMLSTDHRFQGFQISWKALKIQNLQPDPRLPSGGSQKPIFFIKLSKWVMSSQNGSHNLMPSRPLKLISPHSELGFPLCPQYLCILPNFLWILISPQQESMATNMRPLKSIPSCWFI